MKSKTDFISLGFLTLTLGTANAAVITYTPDTLAEFQTSGDVIYSQNNTTLSSTISDPTSESPEQLRVFTSISAPDNATYTHNLIGATFNPSTQGVINDIDFTISVNDPGLPGHSDTPLYLGLEQGGNTYFYTEDDTGAFFFRNTGNTSFLQFTKNGLTASDFGQFPATSFSGVNATRPDFSASGGNIQFLYGSVSASSDANSLTRYTDFHSSELSVDFTPVPEPSRTALLTFSTAALYFRRRRK